MSCFRWSLPILSVFAFLLMTGGAAHRDDPRSRSTRQVVTQLPSAYNVETINLPLDHFSTSTRPMPTFPNRFFINDTFYRPGGPVFLLDRGEDGVSHLFVQDYIVPPRGFTSAVIQLAAQFHGLIVLWEHRFFGESQYFEPDYNGILGGIDTYQYLTIEQALEDVVYLATHFNATSPTVQANLEALKPGNTPWIMVGGSYPGIRSAILRVRNPDIIYAAWASSAPVQSTDAMGDFHDGLQRALPRNCSADIHAAVTTMDSILQGQDEAQQLDLKTELYLAYSTRSTVWTADIIRAARKRAVTLNAADYIDSWSSEWQSSGLTTITPFCDYIERYNPRTSSMYGNLTTFSNSWNEKPSAIGIAKTYDNNTAVRAFITAIHASQFAVSILPQNATNSPVLIDNISYFNVDRPSWAWIRATEFGNWQPTDVTDTGYLFSSLDTLQYDQQDDEEYLGFDLPAPNYTTVNQYGGWNMNPSNVMFTNGDWDGWMTRSVQAQTENGGPGRITTQNIPACNVAPANQGVFGLVYPGVGHVRDLLYYYGALRGFNATGNPLDIGLALYTKALHTWIPCFQKHIVTTRVYPVLVTTTISSTTSTRRTSPATTSNRSTATATTEPTSTSTSTTRITPTAESTSTSSSSSAAMPTCVPDPLTKALWLTGALSGLVAHLL